MAEYLLSVWHDDTFELDFSSEQAQRMGAQVDQFNRPGSATPGGDAGRAQAR